MARSVDGFAYFPHVSVDLRPRLSLTHDRAKGRLSVYNARAMIEAPLEDYGTHDGNVHELIAPAKSKQKNGRR
jgi:hypothetical protein